MQDGTHALRFGLFPGSATDRIQRREARTRQKKKQRRGFFLLFFFPDKYKLHYIADHVGMVGGRRGGEERGEGLLGDGGGFVGGNVSVREHTVKDTRQQMDGRGRETERDRERG